MNALFSNFDSPTKYDNKADLLTCGSCLAEFLLSDIVIFIQHKTSQSCQLKDNSKLSLNF